MYSWDKKKKKHFCTTATLWCRGFLSRSSGFGVMMKRCSRPGWRHCYSEGRALWFDLGFVPEQHLLISLGSTLDYSKANVRHRHVMFLLKHTHMRTDRRTDGRTRTHRRTGTGWRESLSVVSDFQPIHKHKRPLCLASSESLGRVPVRQSATFPPSLQPNPDVLSVCRVPPAGLKL